MTVRRTALFPKEEFFSCRAVEQTSPPIKNAHMQSKCICTPKSEYEVFVSRHELFFPFPLFCSPTVRLCYGWNLPKELICPGSDAEEAPARGHLTDFYPIALCSIASKAISLCPLRDMLGPGGQTLQSSADKNSSSTFAATFSEKSDVEPFPGASNPRRILFHRRKIWESLFMIDISFSSTEIFHILLHFVHRNRFDR